jgi:hypothetical protein
MLTNYCFCTTNMLSLHIIQVQQPQSISNTEMFLAFNLPTAKKLNSVAWVRERTMLRDRRLSAKLLPTFADRGCHVVSMTDPHSHILAFLDQSRYLFSQVAPRLYSQGWVDSDPDPLLLRKSGSAGNRTHTSGSVARNSDHQTTDAVTYSSKNDKFNLLTAKSWGARITTRNWGWILSPSRVKNFSLLHIFETGCGAHPASSIGARAWSPPLTSY